MRAVDYNVIIQAAQAFGLVWGVPVEDVKHEDSIHVKFPRGGSGIVGAVYRFM